MDGPAFPKPKKADRSTRKRLSPNDKTKARKRLYRLLVRPAYLAGLAVGQGRRGTYPTCERCGEQPGVHVHHMAGRDGDMVIDYTKMAALCADCHRLVHAYPLQAREDGWMVSRNGVEEEQG